MSDIFEEPEMTFRERLSLNAEEFEQIVSEILKENEGLKSYIDSGMSDNELVMEKDVELSSLRGEVEKIQKLRINISDHAEKAEITAGDFKLGSYQEGYWEGYAKALYRASDSIFDGLEQLQQREDDGGNKETS